MFAFQRMYNVFNNIPTTVIEGKQSPLSNISYNSTHQYNPLGDIFKKDKRNTTPEGKTKRGKGKNDDDNHNGGGGLLEPIIQDIK